MKFMSVRTHRRRPLWEFSTVSTLRYDGGKNDSLGRSPNVAYHIEHLHRSPHGLVGDIERDGHISIGDLGVNEAFEVEMKG
jgi:hypothetical protein